MDRLVAVRVVDEPHAGGPVMDGEAQDVPPLDSRRRRIQSCFFNAVRGPRIDPDPYA